MQDPKEIEEKKRQAEAVIYRYSQGVIMGVMFGTAVGGLTTSRNSSNMGVFCCAKPKLRSSLCLTVPHPCWCDRPCPAHLSADMQYHLPRGRERETQVESHQRQVGWLTCGSLLPRNIILGLTLEELASLPLLVAGRLHPAHYKSIHWREEIG